MSQWTHIAGCLYVETYKEEKDIEKYVKDLLKNAPVITGSERDADIFVNALSGYNTSINMDCEHCKYKDTVRYLDTEGYFECDAEEGFECPDGEYQSCVAITLIGDFRDRDGEVTRQEVESFIRYLQTECDFGIDYHAITVRDDWDGNYIMRIKYDEEDYMDKGEIFWEKI